jgi:hypothetical protein
MRLNRIQNIAIKFYHGRRLPFSSFTLPDLFLAVPKASAVAELPYKELGHGSPINFKNI